MFHTFSKSILTVVKSNKNLDAFLKNESPKELNVSSRSNPFKDSREQST